MKKQTYKKMFNVAMTTTLAAGAVVAVAPAQTDAAALTFKDLTESNVHYNDIMGLADRGIIGGYTDGTYRPAKSVSRGEAAKIIAGVLELNVTDVKNPNFKDLPTTNVYYNAVAALVEAGVINGFEDNTYRPNDTLTRGQMAKIIAFGFELTASKNENPFKDIDKSIYKDSIIALFDNAVTTGKTATTYGAADQVTRAQLASFVIRAEKAAAKTVEGDFKIDSVDGNTVKINGETFEVSEELKAVFNAENAAALAGSEVKLVIENTQEKVASTTPMFAETNRTIVDLQSVIFNAPNTLFNPFEFYIPRIEVKQPMIFSDLYVRDFIVAPSISFEVATSRIIGAFNLGEGASGVIEDSIVEAGRLADKAKLEFRASEVGSLIANGNSTITLDRATTLGELGFEKGRTLADIITNFESIKDRLSALKLLELPPVVAPPVPVTPPVTGGGGSTGGGGTPETPAKVTFLKDLESKLVATNAIATATLTGETTASPKLTLTVTDSDLTKGQLSTELKGLLAALVSDSTSTTATLSSVTITDTYDKNKVLGLLADYTLNEIGDKVAKELAAKFTGKNESELTTLLPTDDTKIFTVLTAPAYTGTITLNYKDGKTDTLTITLNAPAQQ